VGYGDFYPTTAMGKFWAGLLMCEGVFSVAIITSKISSYFLEEILREGRGAVKTSQLNNHFIICGWKEEMAELLNHILDFDSELRPKDLVLIANITDITANTLLTNEKFKGIHLIQGNYFEAANLVRAAPDKARKILILADRAPDLAGVIPGQIEVDSRTIMTAMTLANIARGTLVAAEILDPKMDQYLKMASVSEVIYSREYSRLLIGNAAGGTGVANIIFDLLDPKTPTYITTIRISEGQHGLPYPVFKKNLEEQNPSYVVIGVLENTGNSQTIKEQALREAQKTPDVAKLVKKLKAC